MEHSHLPQPRSRARLCGSGLSEQEVPTELRRDGPLGVPLLWKQLAKYFDLIVTGKGREKGGRTGLGRQTPLPSFRQCYTKCFYVGFAEILVRRLKYLWLFEFGSLP